jgi:hypothetical protein
MRAVQIFNSSSFLRYIISLSQDTYLPFPCAKQSNGKTRREEQQENEERSNKIQLWIYRLVDHAGREKVGTTYTRSWRKSSHNQGLWIVLDACNMRVRALLGVRRGAGRPVAAGMRRARRGGRLVLHFFFPSSPALCPAGGGYLIDCVHVSLSPL